MFLTRRESCLNRVWKITKILVKSARKCVTNYTQIFVSTRNMNIRISGRFLISGDFRDFWGHPVHRSQSSKYIIDSEWVCFRQESAGIHVQQIRVESCKKFCGPPRVQNTSQTQIEWVFVEKVLVSMRNRSAKNHVRNLVDLKEFKTRHRLRLSEFSSRKYWYPCATDPRRIM